MKAARFLKSNLALLIAAVVITACSTAQSSPTGDSAEAISVGVAPAAEFVHPVVAAASGVVQAQMVVEVGFQVPGKVIAVGPDEGSPIRAGDVLAAIDPTDYGLAVDQAVAQAEHATGDRERYRPLVATGSIAPSDFERIETGAREATAAAGLARKHLADTRLVAPISGIIARRMIERGATATPAQPVFTLMDVDPVRVRVGIPESEIGSIRNGQPAEVHLPALTDATFAGRVTLVGIAADPATRTYAVEISVPNPAHRLKVGMVAEARVEIGQQSRAVSVPAGAVVRDEDGVTVVYVFDARARRAYARRVDVGAARDDAIEITHGLNAGESVIIAGQHRLRDGSRVVVSSAAQSGAGTGGVQ